MVFKKRRARSQIESKNKIKKVLEGNISEIQPEEELGSSEDVLSQCESEESVSVIDEEYGERSGESSWNEDAEWEEVNDLITEWENHHTAPEIDVDSEQEVNQIGTSLRVDKLIDLSQPNGIPFEGLRLVDLGYVLKWICALNTVHRTTCSAANLVPIKERVLCMVSTITLMCTECGATFHGTTEDPKKQQFIRKSTVWATIVSGETFGHTEEFLSHLGVPFMCFEAFSKTQMEMYDVVEAAANDSMKRAVLAEKEKAGTDDGIPYTTVYIDGSWPIRSYGNKYSSRSGAAVIFGDHTKKVLYGGTRNTFCIQCYINKRDNKDKAHRCFVNHSGSAGSIEPAILVDGFRTLLEEGLKIRMVVGDGDSNVFDILKDRVPYGEELQKANCKNHMIKNLKKHLHMIAGRSENDLSRTSLRSKIEAICAGVHAAIMYSAKMGGSDVEGLRHDIRNTIFHVFGVHDGCRAYFCSKNHPEDTSQIDTLRGDVEVFNAAQSLLENVAAEADRLRYGHSTNIAENFMGMITKLNVGKRENLCGRGNYSLRVLVAICLRNEGYGWASELFPKFIGGSLNPFYVRYVRKRENQKLYTDKSVSREEYKKGCTKKLNTERSYGVTKANTMNPLTIASMLDEYKVDNDIILVQIGEIDIARYCKGRILAQHVADIVGTKKQEKLVEKSDFFSAPSKTEKVLRKIFCIQENAKHFIETHTKIDFNAPALIISNQAPFLCVVLAGLSEDGKSVIIAKKVELQNFKRKFSNIREAAISGFKIKNDETVVDNKLNQEAQTAMFVSKADCCFIVFVNGSNTSDIEFQKVPRQDKFFENNIENKFVKFFEHEFITHVALKNIKIKK